MGKLIEIAVEKGFNVAFSVSANSFSINVSKCPSPSTSDNIEEYYNVWPGTYTKELFAEDIESMTKKVKEVT